MVDSSEPARGDELAVSRRRFVSELPERLTHLYQVLSRTWPTNGPGSEPKALQRRLHALAAAARVLKFSEGAEALAEAEALSKGHPEERASSTDRDRLEALLDQLPTLVLGGLRDPRRTEYAVVPRCEPLLVACRGSESLVARLSARGPLRQSEIQPVDDDGELLQRVRESEPDAVVLDLSHEAALELLPKLRQASRRRGLAVVVLGDFEQPTALEHLVSRGVSVVLPRSAEASSLQRSVRRACGAGLSTNPPSSSRSACPAPSFAEWVSQQSEQAFGDVPNSARDDERHREIALTPLWSAFARIQELRTQLGAETAPPVLRGPHGTLVIASVARKHDARHSPRPRETPRIADRRIVVASNSTSQRPPLLERIEGLGVTVLRARGAGQARELVHAHWPDALVTETHLADADGFQLAQRLHGDLGFARLPVLVVAGSEGSVAPDAADPADAADPVADEPTPLAHDPLLEALAEMLLPRSTLERRLAADTRVQGRLDPTTPRLLLELACRTGQSAQVGLRCGGLHYAVQTVDGRLHSVKLLEAGREVARGPEALAPLLGLRVGRFVVQLAAEPPVTDDDDPQFDDDLTHVLAPVLRRARAATGLLTAWPLPQVERVVLSPPGVRQHLTARPESDRSLIAALMDGAPPRRVGAGAKASDPAGQRLQRLLRDLCAAGAVIAALDERGTDLLDTADSTNENASSGDPVAQTLGEAVLTSLSEPAAPARVRREATPASEVVPPEDDASNHDASNHDASNHDASNHDEGARHGSAPQLEGADSRSQPEDDAAPDEEHPEVLLPPSDGRSPWGLLGRVSTLLLGAAAAYAALRWYVPRLSQTEETRDVRRSALSARSPDAGAPVVRVGALPEANAPNQPPPTDDLLAPPPSKSNGPDNVSFTSETLPLPSHTRIPSGQGLLEVRVWKRQNIYVDGVFMGKYQHRLIPLSAGTYELELLSGSLRVTQTVRIRSGQRTRLVARSPSASQ